MALTWGVDFQNLLGAKIIYLLGSNEMAALIALLVIIIFTFLTGLDSTTKLLMILTAAFFLLAPSPLGAGMITNPAYYILAIIVGGALIGIAASKFFGANK